jgi:hypothetical protein
MQTLQDELKRKSEQIIELNQTKAALSNAEQKLVEVRSQVEAELASSYNQKVNAATDQIRVQEAQRNEMKLLELQKKLEDQVRLTEEMSRKQQQGSMQLQGEVQELAIEEWLRSQFPLDSITEVKKGVQGADCTQVVNTREHTNCGIIYYESKRTKEFYHIWIEKFKTDMRANGAGIGILVTEAMPKEMERMGIREGVWICTFNEFKGLCLAIREQIVKVSEVMAAQENKGDKMTLLYNFLTGAEFKSQVDAIIESFSQMKVDLDAEQRAMTNIWKKREKQLEKAIVSTINMHASIKGIGGSAIGTIQILELPS